MNFKSNTGGSSPLYLGFDLSTQQLKALVVDSELNHNYQAIVDFDVDCATKYGVEKGTLTNPKDGEVFAPVAMWLRAIDLVLGRLKEQGLDFARISGVSGAGMQHGSVFWSFQGEHDLETLDSSQPLEDQLADAFAWPYSPNWQDASTQAECDAFDAELNAAGENDNTEELAYRTGSKAHHRFTGPQIMRLRKRQPKAYAETARISLVSSWLASVFLGRIAPFDISDVCGMNLWDIPGSSWNRTLLSLASGGDPDGLERKLHPPCGVSGTLGPVSQYFVRRWGFSPHCQIAPSTGDNPSTILALPLQPHDAMVSLGTSTTFLMSTPTYLPDPSYHFFNHPAASELYMFMLCYKNGGLAREKVRNALNEAVSAKDKKSWDAFNKAAVEGKPLGMDKDSDPVRIGLYFPRPEIVPNVSAGTRRFEYHPKEKKLTRVLESSAGQDGQTNGHANGSATSVPSETFIHTDPRAILESQFLSLRLRSRRLVSGSTDSKMPAQPRRVYLVGGGSVNPAIAELAGQVLGGTEGVYRLDVGGNACALGAAYRAAWACETRGADGEGKEEAGESFEQFIKARWDEDRFVEKIGQGYTKGVWERYELGVEALSEAEKHVLAAEKKS